MYFSLTEPAPILDWSQAQMNEGQVLLILGTYLDRRALAETLASLQRAGVPAFGGLFERVISGAETYDRGCVVATFRSSHSPCVVPGSKQGYRDLAQKLPAPTAGKDQTLLVFTDPEMPELASFIQQLYTHYGNSVEYFGAGVGVKPHRVVVDEPELGCLFTTETGLVTHSSLVALVDHAAGVTARHGWARTGGPMVASRVDAERIHEINWRPAWDVYREALRAVMDEPPDLHGSQREGVIGYPLGMKRAGAEDLLRLPLDVDDAGGMRCVGGVPSHAVLHLLRGSPEELCVAAVGAAKESLDALAGPVGQALLFECVTRFDFLGERFDEELQAIDDQLRARGASPAIGVLARGELSSMKGGYPELLNKTAVVGAFQS